MFLRRVASGEWDAEELAESLMTQPDGAFAQSMDEAIEALRNRLDPPRTKTKWKWKG